MNIQTKKNPSHFTFSKERTGCQVSIPQIEQVNNRGLHFGNKFMWGHHKKNKIILRP